MSYFKVAFLIATLTLVLLATLSTAFVWFWRRRYTKERFAFAALGTIGSLTLALIAAIAGKAMPWHVASLFIEWFTGKKVELPSPDIADYGFLVCIYAIGIWAIKGIFERWDGNVSERHYLLEQERTRLNLAEEGIRELTRLIRREEPPTPYQSQKVGFVAPLDSVKTLAPWRERARELFKLKNPSITIDLSSDWHEEANCWIGRHTKNGNCVGLICENFAPGNNMLLKSAAYATAVADRQDRGIELILALENGPPRIYKFSGVSIRVLTEDGMLSDLVNWDDYLSDVTSRVEQQKLPDSKLTLSEVCVSAVIKSAYPKSEHTEDFEDYIDEWVADHSQRQLALLGDYGQGKSTAALLLTYRHLRNPDSFRIPIHIELRGASPRNLSPLEMLGAWGARYNISAKALMQLHAAGRLLIIFEGFDEMSLIGDAEMRLDHFKTLWQFCSPKAKILITGRPNFFFDEEELIASLGISVPISGKPYCQALRLEPFDVDRMHLALRKHDEAARTQICEFATQNSEFRELVSRPSLLHIVSVLWTQEKLAEKLGTLSSAYVMRLFVQHSYRRQGLKEDASPGFMALTSSEREYFMKGIATFMVTKRLQNQITGVHLKDAIDTLIDSIPESVSLTSSALSGEVREPLANRIAASEYGRDHVHTDVRTCGLLVDDPAATGCFRFGHKSFMEYLFAETLHNSVAESNSHVDISLLNACNARAADIAYLPVSITFLSELLSEESRTSQKNEAGVASTLLRLMLGPGKINYFLGRCILPSLILVSRMRSASLLLRVSVFAFGLFSLLIAAVVLVRGDGGFQRTSTFLASLVTGSVASGIIGAVQASLLMRMRNLRYRSRSRDIIGAIIVWNTVCRKLEIDDEVMHLVAGVGWIPWFKGKPFDYFLDLTSGDFPSS
ncbi:WD repeat-containing protein [Rhodopirellula maiorica SM1]|uniref:WD repeat-containing protein n=1 Tax=Rhodopirellula maiorica SM1 TaxID=1265738 RepID=M5RN04_9BACT|nr:WD repeat-containing protein [Rhodopirellula maiorica]EMI20685.1 WD repeat-containing protein [Rhodopirellula maiorica SM1]